MRSSRSLSSSRNLRLFFFVLLAVSAAIRVLLSVFTKTAVVYNDELYPLKLAQSLWQKGSYSVYNTPASFAGILYPLLIAPFYAIADGVLRLRLISAFNAILISSSLIPGYLLARRILKKNGQVVFSLVCLALSPNLFFSLTFMSENLYLPLLLWAFWAAHRLFSAGKKLRPALLFALFVLLLLLTGPGGLSFHPFSFDHFRTAAHLMYLLYAVLLLLLFFLVSVFWFPVAVPFFFRKRLASENRSLLYLCLGYVLFVSVLVSFRITLADEFRNLTPAICLRYLLGASYPFLLLFLSSLDDRDRLTRKSPLTVGTAVFALLSLLLLFIPGRKGLVDFPILQIVTRMNPLSRKWLWLCRLSLLAFLSAVLFLWNRAHKKPWKRIFSALVLLPLLGLELLSGIVFVRTVRRETAVDPALLREARLVDQALDGLGGDVLLVARDPEEPLLKLLNTVSGRDYYFITGDDVLDRVLALAPENRGSVPLEGFTADYVLTAGSWHLLDPSGNENITPSGVASFALFRSPDPAALKLQDSRNYVPGDLVSFFGDHPTFRYYEPAGFTGPGPLYTWTKEPEVILSFRPQVSEPCDLQAAWTWRDTIGDQPCRVYANDTLVLDQIISKENRDTVFHIPAESYTDSLTLRFVFPEAREPGNGDTRPLAVAFESLILVRK